MASNSEGEMAIPLCLPNNYKWDPERGKCIKTGDERSSLYVVEEALEKLRIIKEPVCVVAIAGPYRTGKSYILTKVFDQPPVFPLGHEFLPETMGIWMWVLPEKHKDSNGKEYSVVLLDSEGIESATGEAKDDNQIFTLTVLLASVLIYNSGSVPKRRDVEDLEYIVNLSQRIHIKSNIGGEASFGDADLFREVFPFFTWLLRDVTLALPRDCGDIKEYFLKKVFQDVKSSPTAKEVVRSILKFFRGFDAFALPPPSADPAVLPTMSNDESQLEPAFVRGLELFKVFLKKFIVPKNSVNAGEFVSGEGLAHLIGSYVDAINSPGAIPNVENAWNVFVKTKCDEVKKAGMTKYNTIMSELNGRLPLDGDEIRNSHDAAFAACENEVIAETAGLSTNTVEDCLDDFQRLTDDRLESWHRQNAKDTEEFCNDLIQQLETQHFGPILQKLKTNDIADLSYQDIMDAYNQLKDDYDRCAIGAKDVISAVFFNLNLKLQQKMDLYRAQLKSMKDYDERLAKEKAARAYQAREMARLQEQMSRLHQENDNCRKKMDHLRIKQEDEIERFRNQMKKNEEDHQEQIQNMKDANEKSLLKQQEENLKNNQVLDREILNLKKENENNLKEIKRLSAEANRNEAPSDWQSSFQFKSTPGYRQAPFKSADESSDEKSAKVNRNKAPSDWQGSFEFKSTPGFRQAPFESAEESSDEESAKGNRNETPSDWQGSFESTDESSDEEWPWERPSANPPNTQSERIERRTAVATRRIEYTRETQETLNAVKEPSFVDGVLGVVSVGAAAIGTAVSIAVPGLAAIAAPVAGLISAGAMVLKKLFSW